MGASVTWFKMFLNFAPLIKAIPSQNVGDGVKAAMDYFKNGREAENLDDMTRAIYEMLKDSIDQAYADCAETSEMKRKAAQARWHSPDADACTCMQMNAEENRTEENRRDTEENTTPLPPPRGAGGGGDDGLSKLLNEFNKGLDDDAIRYVYDVVAVGEHITSRYAYARKILTDITNDREYFPPIFTVDQVKEFLSRRSPEPGNKPKKPMDSRTVTEQDFEGDYYADIMNRKRSVQHERRTESNNQ